MGKDSTTSKKKADTGAKAFKADAITQAVLDHFAEISAIPRKSGNEAQIRDFLVKWAEKHKFAAEVDQVGNLIVRIPASKGMEKRKGIVLQGHLDMVCEKTPDSNHDFFHDPIRLVYDGEWLKADHTTLGADNGIAIAIAQCLMTDSSIKHPAVELLFTVEEETGLTGANGLKPGTLNGKYLINIDSENDNVFTVGCAGGKDTHIELDLDYEEVPNDYVAMQLMVGGCTGGHSGENIVNERANAIRVLARVLHRIREHTDVRLIGVLGGTAHNAIPRDAEATFYVPVSESDKVAEIVAGNHETIRSEFTVTDPGLRISLKTLHQTPDRRAMLSYISLRVLDLIIAIPHGVAARSTEMPHLVETSSNLAKVWVNEGRLFVLTSQRSSVMSRRDAITARIEAVARLGGARYHSGNGYPSWRPDFNSALLKKCCEIYESLFKEKPRVEAIHAGLECGLIGNLHPGMQMISLGPTIRNPHSPEEKMFLPSLPKVYSLLKNILAEL
ncbi:MAG TPA: aminoacyl-histidine dipeptidase [Candidatus Ozemobacteraceae bacterium]|nr:aminoacyl-histidine dipeptidase [Candidatus Ozemobacteraceae bacterium]